MAARRFRNSSDEQANAVAQTALTRDDAQMFVIAPTAVTRRLSDDVRPFVIA